jgi:hypothetical protein|tara:strand:- start:1035 stop:1190 length:156 start_codon:yes stop_codon:yes gene_type:complete
MLGNTISILQSNKFYGAGEFTELAKGKNELVSDWRGFKDKITRVWQSRKRL